VSGAYRAILFDYGGVLTSPIQLSIARFFVDTGVDPERFKAVIADAYAVAPAPKPARDRGGHVRAPEDALASWHGSGLVAALETGRLPLREFEARLAAALSDGLASPLVAEGLAARLFDGLEPDPVMLDAVRAARRLGLRTAVVSNTWGSPPALTGLAGLFDAFVLSHREGCRKPDAAIYLLAAARLGVAPEACVFVDDIPVNVEGAEAVGMAGVLHRAAPITLARLEDRLGVSLGRP
jgi:epoxide hydrolase-like predicted phosphatase